MGRWPWSKGTSQFDAAELKLIQWRRGIETRAQRTITVQLGAYCSCLAARLRGATASPSGPVMRQLFCRAAVYPSGRPRHPSPARRRQHPAENEGHVLAGTWTARRIFSLRSEYEPETCTNEKHNEPPRTCPAGLPGGSICPRLQLYRRPMWTRRILRAGPHKCSHSGCSGWPNHFPAHAAPGCSF